MYWCIGYKYIAPDYLIVVSKSTDNGANWTRYTLSSGSGYRYPRALAVDPSAPNRVFVMAYQDNGWILYRTTDGGTNWSTQTMSGYQGTPSRLVVNPNDSDHLAAATTTGLFSSTDGGATWSRVTTAFGNSSVVTATNDGMGLLVGTVSQGIWLWDGWTGTPVQICTEPMAITNLLDGPNLYLYAGTPAASVWRSYYGTGVEESSSGVETGFSLRVFPNPASGGLATVNFTLPVPGGANLSVYDISGRLVENLSAPVLEAGEHAWSLSTSGFVPGVYFARLSHQGVTATTRMVVVP